MISENDGRLYVAGPMNQQTAAELKDRGETLIGAGRDEVSLRDVTTVDSSALAVALAWLRAARGAGHSMTILEAPPAFRSLANLYGVEEILFPENPTISE